MAKSKSDISNDAIRIFLQMVGKFYDEQRGYKHIVRSKKVKAELLREFSNKCCFCGANIDDKSISLDHLIPINKNSLGLDAWGNVVPCCNSCNKSKHNKNWEEFISELNISEEEKDQHKAKICEFVISKDYNPNLQLKNIVDDLYEDVGEVALTLISLRYKQAQENISHIIASSDRN